MKKVFTHSSLDAGGTAGHAGPHGGSTRVSQETAGIRESMGNNLYCCFSWKGKARPGRVNRLRLATLTNFSKLSGVWPLGDQGGGMMVQNVSTL